MLHHLSLAGQLELTHKLNGRLDRAQRSVLGRIQSWASWGRELSEHSKMFLARETPSSDAGLGRLLTLPEVAEPSYPTGS